MEKIAFSDRGVVDNGYSWGVGLHIQLSNDTDVVMHYAERRKGRRFR